MKNEKNVVNVSELELLRILMTQEIGTFCNLLIKTKVRMNKTNNPFFDRVSKITSGNVLLGVSYEKRVQNETNNPDFVPEKNNVGEKISKCVRHNEKLGRDYLDYEWFEEVLPKSEYVLDGNDPIEKIMFESYRVKSSPNKYGVNYQSVMLSNIHGVTLNKTRYEVIR